MALVLAKKSSYDPQRIRRDVFEMLDRLEGGIILSGAKVLIKPNLLTVAAAEQAITTHPLLIRAVAEYVLSKGGKPLVADSPPMGSFERILQKCGIKDALDGLPVEARELGRSTRVTLKEGARWKHIELSADALEADVIINMPKLKTHAQMGLTLAVKNLFGCIMGMKKPEWHFRIGENRQIFAELLATTYGILMPRINLMDGILAMEGDGPGAGGTPRELGIIVGSNNAHAMDKTICMMLGIPPETLPTVPAAAGMGLDEEVETLEPLPEIKGFKIPEAGRMLLGPSFAHGFLRSHMGSRPYNDERLCRLCNECVNICPARAISRKGKRLEFDYDKCIRCYCCLEICPHAAVRKRETLVRKAILKYLEFRG